MASHALANTQERLTLETDLRRAVERGEWVLHYQLMVDLSTGVTTGLEAWGAGSIPRAA
jgi:sensor c-di-GMP phosphodiesterase-like protein